MDPWFFRRKLLIINHIYDSAQGALEPRYHLPTRRQMETKRNQAMLSLRACAIAGAYRV